MIKLIENQDSVKDIKENLMRALTIFNCDIYIINDYEYDVAEYENEAGTKYILVPKGKDDDWVKRVTNVTLNNFYDVCYSSGTQCHHKSVLLRKIFKELSPNMEIDECTLMSFMLVLNRYASELQTVTNFWYHIMLLKAPQIFEK